jgi:hypothetical protein
VTEITVPVKEKPDPETWTTLQGTIAIGSKRPTAKSTVGNR